MSCKAAIHVSAAILFKAWNGHNFAINSSKTIVADGLVAFGVRIQNFVRHHRTSCNDGGMVAKDNQAESHIVSEIQ